MHAGRVDHTPDLTPPEETVTGRVIQPQTRAKVDTAWRARVAGATWRQAAELAGYSDEHAVMKAVRVTYGTLPRFERDDLRNMCAGPAGGHVAAGGQGHGRAAAGRGDRSRPGRGCRDRAGRAGGARYGWT